MSYYESDYDIDFGILKGKILTNITGGVGEEEMIFTTDSGEKFVLYHSQNCCEIVYIEDIIGDLSDLIGTPIIMAEVVISNKNPKDVNKELLHYQDESFTWTFYKLATIKGYVTIRWYGGSNGYYSEEVNFQQIRR